MSDNNTANIDRPGRIAAIVRGKGSSEPWEYPDAEAPPLTLVPSLRLTAERCANGSVRLGMYNPSGPQTNVMTLMRGLGVAVISDNSEGVVWACTTCSRLNSTEEIHCVLFRPGPGLQRNPIIDIPVFDCDEILVRLLNGNDMTDAQDYDHISADADFFENQNDDMHESYASHGDSDDFNDFDDGLDENGDHDAPLDVAGDEYANENQSPTQSSERAQRWPTLEDFC